MKWRYGDSWEKYPIEEKETWVEPISNSIISVCDIRFGVPDFVLDADMIYCDPPWSQGNANTFLTKAYKGNYVSSFEEFYAPLFSAIKKINPQVCFLEIGKQNINVFIDELKSLFPLVNVYEITYYKKSPCFLIRGGYHKSIMDYTGYDDENTPYLTVDSEDPTCVCDLCTGRGLTMLAAHKLSKRFVGLELNKRRLAVAIDRASKAGFHYEKDYINQEYSINIPERKWDLHLSQKL